MLFIQSSCSVTIPLLQHSTAYWRNTTEQISVKITVCKSHKGDALSPLFILDFYFFFFSPRVVLVVGDKGSAFFLINRKGQPVCVRGMWYSAKYDCVSINTLKNKRTVEPSCNVIIEKCSQTTLALIRVHTLKTYTA